MRERLLDLIVWKRGVMIGDTFDTYSAKYSHTYPPSEVVRWFQAAGFDAIKHLLYATTVRGRKVSDAA